MLCRKLGVEKIFLELKPPHQSLFNVDKRLYLLQKSLSIKIITTMDYDMFGLGLVLIWLSIKNIPKCSGFPRSSTRS